VAADVTCAGTDASLGADGIEVAADVTCAGTDMPSEAVFIIRLPLRLETPVVIPSFRAPALKAIPFPLASPFASFAGARSGAPLSLFETVGGSDSGDSESSLSCSEPCGPGRSSSESSLSCSEPCGPGRSSSESSLSCSEPCVSEALLSLSESFVFAIPEGVLTRVESDIAY